MKPAVLAFAGAIGSGKSTLSVRVAETLGWQRVSFGDYVRAEARRRGLSVERETLQALGAALISLGWESFCKAVLAQGSWTIGQPLVIDGVRHTEAIPTLRNLVFPLKLYFIYIEVDKETQIQRLGARDPLVLRHLSHFEMDSTEEQVHIHLPEIANLILDGRNSVEALEKQVVQWLDTQTQLDDKCS